MLRAGYGMFYGFLGQRRGDVIQSGFSQNTNIIPSLDNGLTFIGTLTNPFPNGITGAARQRAGHRHVPRPEHHLLRSQPEVAADAAVAGRRAARAAAAAGSVEASYVGNHGSQLQTNRNLNATPNQYLSTSPVRDADRIDYLSANIPNPFFGLLPTTAAAALQGANIQRERLLRPYPQFDAVNTTTNEGWSWYHALQSNLQRRFSSGYTMRIELYLLEVHRSDRVPERGRSRAVGRHLERRRSAPADGQRHPGAAVRTRPPLRRATANAVLSAFIGGWQVAGIYTYQSGFPIGFGNIIFTGDLDDIDLAGERADGGALVQHRRRLQQGLGAGSSDQNVRTFPLRLENVRTDNVNNVDLSLIKNTQVAGKTFEFRFESLNAFNHPLLPGASTRTRRAEATSGRSARRRRPTTRGARRSR